MPFVRAATFIRAATIAYVVCYASGWPVVHSAETPQSDCAASELLPSTVIALAEIHAPSEVVKTVMEYPMRQRLMDLPAYEKFTDSKEFKRLQMGIRAFEGSMKEPWPAALQSLTASGVTIALDAQHDGGVALLVKSSDAESLERFRDFLLGLQLLGGKSAQQGQYRDFTAYSLAGNLKMVLLDNWFVLTNKPALGKSIIDQYLDRKPQSLATNPSFMEASNQRNAASKPAAWAFVDIEAIRQAGIAKDLFQERVGNFFGELALGGILANLRHTPFATLALEIEPTQLQLKISSPHARQWEPPREYYFGDGQMATAPPLLEVENRLFALSTHRDLSQLWLRSGDLLSDRVLDQLAQADTQLTTFFSGKDFGEDILGSISGEIQFVSKVQEFSDEQPVPAIKLPAFALQFRLKEPEASRADLRRVFQSFIGFINVTGAQNGQPQFDLGMESIGSAQLHSATYVANRNLTDANHVPIFYNFSPTIGFAADNFIIASTTPLARELATQTSGSGDNRNTETANTFANLDAQHVKTALEINHGQLVANNMLEKGQSQAAAEEEIGLLLDLIGMLNDADFRFDADDQQLQLRLTVKVDE